MRAGEMPHSLAISLGIDSLDSLITRQKAKEHMRNSIVLDSRQSIREHLHKLHPDKAS